jgi:hypothetical protein
VTFLIDHLTLVGSVLVLVGLALGYVRLRSGGAILFLVAILSLLLGAGALITDVLFETPIEQVGRRLDGMISAAEAGDEAFLVNALAASYHDGRRDRQAMADLIRVRIDEADFDHVRIAGLEFARVNEDVEASFVAHVRGSSRGSAGYESFPIRLKILFRKEGSTWQVGSIRRFDVVQSGREVDLDSWR